MAKFQSVLSTTLFHSAYWCVLIWYTRNTQLTVSSTAAVKYEFQVRLHCIHPHSSLRHSEASVHSSPLARTLLSIERLES